MADPETLMKGRGPHKYLIDDPFLPHKLTFYIKLEIFMQTLFVNVISAQFYKSTKKIKVDIGYEFHIGS